ncbi:MAG: squalene/phytoene synthase family protein [Chloroflexota bacterium]
MSKHVDAITMLRDTSRTFFIPISRLPDGLYDAVMSGYLCLRAIDQVEDHPDLDHTAKAAVLRSISRTLQTNFDASSFAAALAPYEAALEEVTLRVGEWAVLAPPTIAPRIWEATATMADRMAGWAEDGWNIQTEADLDRYTFGVAGSVGLLLSDLWAWYDGTQTDRTLSIGFGRGLQTVNILRNRREDLGRGVDFFPGDWHETQMHAYTSRQLALAQAYVDALPAGPVLDFCIIPLALAQSTLTTLADGEEKLTRGAVLRIIKEAELEGAARRNAVGR